MLAIKTILHPTDFSECSDHALHLAASLARDHGSRLIVLHVAPIPAAGPAAMMPVPPTPELPTPEMQEELEKRRPSDPEVAVEHRFAVGNPARSIVDLARAEGCELIVMGTHGRSGLERLVMGSVAEMVLRQASCSVLMVKKPLVEAEAAERRPVASALPAT